MPPTSSDTTAITIERADPRGHDAAALLEILSQILTRITGASGNASFEVSDVETPGSRFLIAYDSAGRAVGCGSYRRQSESEVEIKRMLALPGTRGVGAALLEALELAARDDGYRTVILETRRVNAPAVAFYTRHGYAAIPNFGRYRGRAEVICFAKQLGG
jgi:GNAT superfamily N-acetyltransferase